MPDGPVSFVWSARAMEVDVDALMDGELGEWLSGQSPMRAEAMGNAIRRWKWGTGGAVLFALWVWFVSGWSGPFAFFVIAAIAFAVGVIGYLPIAKATKAIKIGINSAIARSLGVSYDHEVEAGREFDIARTFGLLPSFERRTLEDCWSGTLGGHRFKLYEAHLEVRRGGNKNKRWETVFRGAIIAMQFGRAFDATVLLQRAGAHRKWLGLGGRKYSVRLGGLDLDFVDQVHPAFEDTFDVYGSDQVGARVLVHPSYVEHLLALEKAFLGDRMRALFHRGEVVIAVESGNLFESGAIDASGDRERVREAASQFGSLAKLALAINQSERGSTSVQAAAQAATGTV